MKIKLRKGMTLGALAAENDELLKYAFLDVGYISALADTANPRFLLLGRAGSGKTALLTILKDRLEHVSQLDPDELSMQYLHSSPILRTLSEWNVNLDIFYKYLWRHVCILELIRMRYGDVGDVPSKIQQMFDFAQVWKKEERKTKEVSHDYLKKYGDDYWVKTDTRIKTITSEVETKLRSDPSIASKIGASGSEVSFNLGKSKEQSSSTKVEQQIVERAQAIVSDFQVAALNRVIERLSEREFNDSQRQFYLVIDDLDKNWMPDDVMYLQLLKSLLFTVRELNGKMQNVKIIVALRDNIHHRVFQRAAKHEPQREKWLDVQLGLTWSRADLLQLVNRRLQEVFRGEYTLKAPHLGDLLPDDKKRTKQSAIDYIMERTLQRPRDIIDFINTCISQADSFSTLSWSSLTRAESEFSQRRLQSVFDEWKDSYFGLPAIFPVLKRIGPKFAEIDFSETELYSILQDPRVEQCDWLKDIQAKLLKNQLSCQQAKAEILEALYLVGIVGVKQEGDSHITYSFERAFNFASAALATSTFLVHKMFWNALGLSEKGKPS